MRKRLSALRPSEIKLEYSGIATIKVSRLDEQGREVSEILELPIRVDDSVLKFIQDFSAKAPKPPVVEKWIKADSEVGRALKLTKDQVCMVYDTTDPRFVEENNKHSVELVWKLVALVLDLDVYLTDSAGNEKKAETVEEKIEGMKQCGFTDNHVAKIAEAAFRLVGQAQDEVTDFFVGR